jgi:hypothetical protein
LLFGGQGHGDTTRDKEQATRRRSPETEVVRSNRWLEIERFILVSSERYSRDKVNFREFGGF